MSASLADSISRLRSIERSGGATGKQLVGLVQPLLEAAYNQLEQIPDGTERTILTGGWAYALAALMPRLQDTGFMGQAMSRLLALGPVGEVLSLRVLREAGMPMDRLAAMLGMCPPHQQLALANRFFQNPMDLDRRRLDWAVSTVRSIQGEDPEEALVFLDRLEARGGELAYPTQRELMRSRFGVWVLELLRMELDDEQLIYMARIVGILGVHSLAQELARQLQRTESAGAIEAILHALARAGEPRSPGLVDTVRPYLRHERKRVRDAALDALVSLRAAGMLASEPEFIRRMDCREQCRVLSRLSAGEYRAIIKTFDPADRQEILLWLTSLVRRVDSEWLDATAAHLAKTDGSDNGTMELVLSAFNEFVRAQPTYTPKPANQGAPPVLAGISPLGVSNFGQQRPSALSGQGSSKLVSDRKIKDAKLKGAAQRGASIRNAAYKNTVIDSSDFSGAQLEATRFLGCTFKNVDFSQARLTTVSFSGCTFSSCLFEGAVLAAVSFRDCRLVDTHFTESKAKRIRLMRSSLLRCDLGGAILESLEAEAASFAGCHFGGTSLLRGEFAGVELTECCFAGSLITGTRMNEVEVVACSFAANRLHNDPSGEPVFLEQEEQARRTAMERCLTDMAYEEPPPALSSMEGRQLLGNVLWRWFFEKDARKRLCACRQVNHNRRLWASAMLQGDSRDLLALLPALVESPEIPGVPIPPLSCAITGHTPGLSTVSLLEKYGLSRPDHNVPSTLRIEALYTIGSTGTIAQDRSSDLDLWVCYDKAELTELHVRALRAKLTAIEQWAWTTFGQEVHFFLMDLDAIHANDFGYSDEESAGSTQALLLKEEFYRTAVLLAGRPLSWWATPPRMSREQYTGHQDLLRESVSLRGVDFLDLGVMEAIPRDEYFGAALWQIVKALKSPFKSILKLALLDKYSMGEERRMLLCETIKEALFNGRCDVWEVDPYAVMFREVFEHFQAQGYAESCDLLRLAFNKKTGLTLAAAASDRAFAMRGYSYMEYFFPYSEAAMAGRLERRHGEDDTEDEESFAALVAVGDRILKFMLNTYAAVQERLAEAGPNVRVSPEDLTKMGRRIAVRLTPGPNKVLPLPFIRMRPGMLAGLELTWRPTGKNEAVWSVRAEFPKRDGGKPAPEVLRSEPGPEELAAWLVANEVYDPSVPLTAQNLAPPLSIPDMQQLLNAMRDFFPVPRVFDPPVQAGLQEERAVRVFIMVNFAIPREVPRLSQIAVVWSSTWGQMLCKARLPATEKLRSDPYTELAKAMGMPMASKPAVMFHVPHKAQCPAVKLLNT